jgi:hypothetical protein
MGADLFPLAIPVDDNHIEDLDVIFLHFKVEGMEPTVIIPNFDDWSILTFMDTVA